MHPHLSSHAFMLLCRVHLRPFVVYIYAFSLRASMPFVACIHALSLCTSTPFRCLHLRLFIVCIHAFCHVLSCPFLACIHAFPRVYPHFFVVCIHALYLTNIPCLHNPYLYTSHSAHLTCHTFPPPHLINMPYLPHTTNIFPTPHLVSRTSSHYMHQPSIACLHTSLT
jgi:hypothetical protein